MAIKCNGIHCLDCHIFDAVAFVQCESSVTLIALAFQPFLWLPKSLDCACHTIRGLSASDRETNTYIHTFGKIELLPWHSFFASQTEQHHLAKCVSFTVDSEQSGSETRAQSFRFWCRIAFKCFAMFILDTAITNTFLIRKIFAQTLAQILAVSPTLCTQKNVKINSRIFCFFFFCSIDVLLLCFHSFGIVVAAAWCPNFFGNCFFVPCIGRARAPFPKAEVTCDSCECFCKWFCIAGFLFSCIVFWFLFSLSFSIAYFSSMSLPRAVAKLFRVNMVVILISFAYECCRLVFYFYAGDACGIERIVECFILILFFFLALAIENLIKCTRSLVLCSFIAMEKSRNLRWFFPSFFRLFILLQWKPFNWSKNVRWIVVASCRHNKFVWRFFEISFRIKIAIKQKLFGWKIVCIFGSTWHCYRLFGWNTILFLFFNRTQWRLDKCLPFEM